ncbi:MAG: hypothetical protein ABJQ39_03515 [Winogradskyella arenosi]
MVKYSSSSKYSNFTAAIAALMVLGLGIAIANSLEMLWAKVYCVVVAIALMALMLVYQRRKTFEIKFLESEILIDYPYLKTSHKIPYADLLEIQFVSGYREPDTNSIKFRIGSKIKSLRFLTVAHADFYIEFIKWLKSKNDNIELKVFPSDHIMNHKIQEVYGFKYRKMVKKTL